MSDREDEEDLIEEAAEEGPVEPPAEEEELEEFSGFSVNSLEMMLERVEEWYRLIRGGWGDAAAAHRPGGRGQGH